MNEGINEGICPPVTMVDGDAGSSAPTNGNEAKEAGDNNNNNMERAQWAMVVKEPRRGRN
jgi:hypothetical protein